MHIRKIGDISLHYQLDGPENGIPLVFSNSLGTDFRSWDKLIPLLPDRFRILRYDMRGHGLSDAPDGPYFMGDLVQDVAGLMDALGVKNAVFVGLSIGGMIAQGLAAERPDLISTLVLSNTGVKIGTEDMWNERIAAIQTGGIEALADSILTRWFSRRFHDENSDELTAWRHMLCRTPQQGYIGACHAIANTDLYESTAQLRLPTLAIAGAHDGSTPPDMVRETANLIPGSRFEIVSTAGHLPSIESPDTFVTLLIDFLKEHANVGL